MKASVTLPSAFCPIHVKPGSCCYDAGCNTALLMKKKKKICCQTIYLSSSPNTKLARSCDNPDDCKIGGKLPAAVCKLIIIPPGVCLINLTDV